MRLPDGSAESVGGSRRFLPCVQSASTFIGGRKCAETAKVHPDTRIVYNHAHGDLARKAGRFPVTGNYTTKIQRLTVRSWAFLFCGLHAKPRLQVLASADHNEAHAPLHKRESITLRLGQFSPLFSWHPVRLTRFVRPYADCGK